MQGFYSHLFSFCVSLQKLLQMWMHPCSVTWMYPKGTRTLILADGVTDQVCTGLEAPCLMTLLSLVWLCFESERPNKAENK